MKIKLLSKVFTNLMASSLLVIGSVGCSPETVQPTGIELQSNVQSKDFNIMMEGMATPSVYGLNKVIDSNSVGGLYPSYYVDLNQPRGLAINASNGKIYVADTKNHVIKEVYKSDVINTYITNDLAGSTAGFKNASGFHVGQFNSPYDVAVDSKGNLYVSDMNNHCIRKITIQPPEPDSLESEVSVTTFAGRPKLSGSKDGKGMKANFKKPAGLAFDKDDNLYVADSGNHQIRKITPDGTVTTLAGKGSPGFKNGSANQAKFYNPLDIAVTSDGKVLIADTRNNRIRQIDEGQVTTVAGNGTYASVDGVSSVASFPNPTGLTLKSDGELMVVSRGDSAIRKVELSGTDSMVTSLSLMTMTGTKLSNPGDIEYNHLTHQFYMTNTGKNQITEAFPLY